eukprot:m.77738 g.77738  ORF g.77738 m.77738 type:complete len:346 (+) comp19132_c0_seq2:112-1149(+)
MGRKKIAIKYIDDPKKRKITLSKRKSGLLKKAYELSVLCGCEMGIVIFDSDQKLYSYGSRGIEKTVKKWQGTKTVPSANWSNDDFDEDSGKFRRRNGGGAAAADDDEGDSSDEDEETPVKAKAPQPRKPSKGSTPSLFPSIGAAGKGRKRTVTHLPLLDTKPAKRHSNPRKTALEKGVFSMLPPSSFSTKGSVGSVRSTNAVKPVLTPSLAASVGVAVADASMGQHLLDISTADINGGLKGKRLTRSASTTPNALARAAGAPFTADFAASGTADGLSPWLMSAVSTIEAPSNGSSSYLPSSTGLGLTPGLSLTPLVAKGSVSDAGAWLLPDEPILGARSTRNRSK